MHTLLSRWHPRLLPWSVVQTRWAASAATATASSFFSAPPLPLPSVDDDSPDGTEIEESGGGGGAPKGGDTLGRRLLSLVYTKRKAVVVLRKWMEEGKTVQKYQLNCVVRELRKLKRYKHALEICEWMTTQPYIKLIPGDYAIHLDLIAKVRGLSSAEKFFEDLPERMKIQSTYAALLHAFTQNNSLDKAESLMEKMSALDLIRYPLPYNHMLTLYIKNGQLDKVPKLMKDMKRNTTPDQITYNLLLSVFAKKNDVEGAEQVILQMEKDKVSPDWMSYSVLANIYLKSDYHDKAKEALNQMETRVFRKDRVAYCSLISLYTRLLDKDNVYRVWNKMKDTYRKMSDVEYRCILSSLTDLGDIEESEKIYKEWESVSGTQDSRISNILLAFYKDNDMMDKAERFYAHTVETGVKPSYTTWELLIWVNLQNNKVDKALDCLQKALSSVEKWEPNVDLTREIFCKLEKMGNVEDGERLLVILRDAGYVTTEIYNTLLRTYVNACQMPLIIAERMKKDNVLMDDETQRLLQLTRNFSVAEVSTLIS